MGELTICVHDAAVCLCVVEFIEVGEVHLVAVEGALADTSINVSVLSPSHCLGKDHVQG